MFSHHIIYVALVACVVVTAYDINEYANQIKHLLTDPIYEAGFQDHIKNLLHIDPDYFDYKGYQQNIECKTYSPSNEIPSSVHKLRPGL